MNLSPLPIQKFFGNDGQPLVGGLLFTYVAGTTTKIATYTDSTGGTPNTNPIVLDYRGECSIWLDPTLTYKFVLAPSTDTDPPSNAIWTADNITAGPAQQDNSAVDTGVVNGIVLSIAQISSPAAFTRIVFKAANSNTSATTITLNGGAAKNLTWQSGAPLSSGAIIAGGIYTAIFDGAQWQLQGPTLDAGDVRLYGAKLDGVTDDTAAFQAASAASLRPYSPSGSTVISGSIAVRSNQNWELSGTRISITGTTVQVFTATTVNDWSIRGSWTVTGDNDNAGSLTGTAAAIKIVDSQRWYLSAPVAKNIRGWGVIVQAGGSTSPRAEHGVIDSPQCFACYVGIELQAGTGAEYITIKAPNITRCNTGMVDGAGNTVVSGGSISDNTDNIRLETGANHGHGIFSGVDINHAVNYNVRTDGVTNGYTFVGCHLYDSSIWLKDSNGVMFKSCVVDPNAFYFQGSDGCGFIDCTMPGGSPNTINNSFNASPSYTVWNNCQSLTGEIFGGVIGGIKGIRVDATSGGITYTPANLAAQQTVLLVDSTNYAANDVAQTLYDGYSNGTGKFTCRGKGDDKVRVTAQLAITNNAADDMKNVFMYIGKNGTSVLRWLNRTYLTTTKTVFSFDGIVELSKNDTIEFRIGGTTANNVTIAAAETDVIVEGL